MQRNLCILGTSGHAREMAQLVQQVNAIQQRWLLLGFIGESGCPVGRNLGMASIIGDDEWLLSQGFQADLVLGIGYPSIRKKVVERYLTNSRFSFPNLVHPNVVIEETVVRLGEGNTISPGCIFTCNIVVGDFNHFNYNSTVGHDVKVGSYNVINPGANISGNAQLADGILVGTGAQVLQNLRIGTLSIVGAGAVVTKNVEPHQTVVGVPARPLAK